MTRTRIARLRNVLYVQLYTYTVMYMYTYMYY